MMNNLDQEQKSGNNSQNWQAGRDLIIQGLSYSETKDLVKTEAQEVFKNNSIKLANDAFQLVLSRSDEFLDEFLRKLELKSPQAIESMRDPGMQYSLYNAQKEYAKTGDKSLADLLEDILVDRAQNPERDLMQIVLDECITVAPKLTPDQFDTLSLIFITRYTVNSGVRDINSLHDYLIRYILPFREGIREEVSRYQHLEFSGCGSVSMSSINIPHIFRDRYSIVFSKGFTLDEFHNMVGIDPKLQQFIMPCLNDPTKFQICLQSKEKVEELGHKIGLTIDEIRNITNLQESRTMTENEVSDLLVSIEPSMYDLIKLWDKSQIKNMTLTSVGIAIAHANCSRKQNIKIDLKIWIN